MAVLNQKGSKSKDFHRWMKEFYEDKADRIANKNYENYRWFSTKVKRRQYNQSKKFLLYHTKDINFKDCLEVGCGPGTWTRVLMEKYPGSNFTCVDISEEMIRQFKKKTKSKRIKFKVSSFLDFESSKEYDFLFCSRAIEYMFEKDRVISKFYRLMSPGSQGIVITSPPHQFILFVKKLFGKKIDKEHTRRISVKKMEHLLRENGFQKIRFYPALFSDFFLVPNSFLFKSLYKKRWGIISKIFATGYVVKFQKPLRGQ